jgi:hypothetical protein
VQVGTRVGYNTLYYFEKFSIYALLTRRNVSPLCAGSLAIEKRPKNEDGVSLSRRRKFSPFELRITFIGQG